MKIRMLPQEKMRKGIKLVELLAGRLSRYGHSHLDDTLEMYPNWRTDSEDYSTVIRDVRRMLNAGRIELCGHDCRIRVMEKAADRAYKRAKGPPTEEAIGIMEKFFRESYAEGPSDLEDLRLELGLPDRAEIMEYLERKYGDYRKRRSEKIQ